jgi:hypothetical protein
MTTALPGNFREEYEAGTNKWEKKADTEAVATVILKLPQPLTWGELPREDSYAMSAL